MNLLMISGDRSLLQGKRGAFFYMLEEFSKHWDRIDVICPHVRNATQSYNDEPLFGKVYIHPSSYPLFLQPWWILKKEKELFSQHYHEIATVHDYPPFYNGIGAFLLKRSTGLPYALEIHHVVGFPIAASPIELIGKALSFLFLRFDAKGAAAVRTVSSNIKSTLLSLGIPEEKISLVPSFYLDPQILRCDTTVTKQYDLVFAARLVANKGLDELLEVMQLLPQVSLLIIGDGPLRKRYETYVQMGRIENRVTFTGWLDSHEEVVKHIQSGRIFVMNSKSEGGPRSALEAMACGVPLISTKVGVMPDVIEDKTNGLFTTGTTADLKEKVALLLGDGRMQAQFHELGPRILQRFDRSVLIQSYADFLQSLV